MPPATGERGIDIREPLPDLLVGEEVVELTRDIVQPARKPIPGSGIEIGPVREKGLDGTPHLRPERGLVQRLPCYGDDGKAVG